MLTMKEAKALAKSNLASVAGEEFACDRGDFYGNTPTGATGRILPELSVRGKPQAELTCIVAGCTETHIREISDWHQCAKCHTHGKAKAKSAGPGLGTGGARSVKLEDGTVIREMKVQAGDDAEMVSLKEQNNALFEKLYAAEQGRRDAEKEQAKAEREAKQAEDKKAREAKAAEEQKVKAKEALARAQSYVAKYGGQVSAKTVEAAES